MLLPERQVIHLDVADFAVAVERVVDPALRERPVVVAPPTSRALAMSVSPEAREEGVRPGMPLRQALRRCPGLISRPPNAELYARAFMAVRQVAARFSPVTEPRSHGRVYLDISGTERLFGPPVDLAARLRREIIGELRLDAAVGVAVNKLVSRVAADLTEPAGLLDIRTGDEATFLAPLGVGRLPGVGEAAYRQLAALNVRTVRQLTLVELPHLTMVFGRFGLVLHQRALGIDPRPVLPPGSDSGIKRQETLAEDSNDPAVLRYILRGLVEDAGREMRVRGLSTSRVNLDLIYSDTRHASGSSRLAPAMELDEDLRRVAGDLLERVMTRRIRIRTISFRLSGLARRPRQLDLFEDRGRDRHASLTTALDRVRSRFGEDAVRWGKRETAA